MCAAISCAPTRSFAIGSRADGSAGPSGSGGFKAEPGRYHLFVSYNCPWAHRTIIFRKLKKLEGVISMSLADKPKSAGLGLFAKPSTIFNPKLTACFACIKFTPRRMPNYTGKVTVPTLWDRERRTIVNNESSEIIRMFNAGFRRSHECQLRFLSGRHCAARSTESMNSSTAISTMASIAPASRAARKPTTKRCRKCLSVLDQMEKWLGERRYLAGDRITEADWRAFPTLLRFDPVYHGHFKCNLRRVQDYPNLANYLRELYQWPGIKETFDLQKTKAGYYSQLNVNPTGIVPIGPDMSHLELPHDRGRLRC